MTSRSQRSPVAWVTSWRDLLRVMSRQGAVIETLDPSGHGIVARTIVQLDGDSVTYLHARIAASTVKTHFDDVVSRISRLARPVNQITVVSIVVSGLGSGGLAAGFSSDARIWMGSGVLSVVAATLARRIISTIVMRFAMYLIRRRTSNAR